MSNSMEAFDNMASSSEEYVQKPALILTPDELSTEVLRSYLTSWKQGGAEIVSFSARGIEHFSQLLGLSIVETKFEESPDGSGFYITAVSENLQTGQRATGAIWQPKAIKRGGRETIDHDALSKGFTRAQRNAHTKLLPIEMLKSRVMQAVQKGSVQQPPLVTAQTICRGALRRVTPDLKRMYDLGPGEAFEIAQTKMGSSEEWSETEWNQFTERLNDLGSDDSKLWFKPEAPEELGSE